MKILVAIKQVPVRDSQLKIAPSGQWIDESDLSYEINEPDAYALEEALQLTEKNGGEVVVLSAGPERAAQALREALAKGAARGIHVVAENTSQFDSLAMARLLAPAIRAESPDLTFTGLQSDDLGSGQTGVILAELLGLPHAAIVMEVEPLPGAVRVKRELENGWFQRVELPVPALLTIQSGIKPLRYATLMGIRKARAKEIRRVQPEPAEPPSLSTDRIYPPASAKQTQIFEGDPREAVAKLVEKLRFEARVL